MKFDKYTRKARVYPSIIILIPFLIFTLYCEIEGLKDVFDNLLQVKILGNITISVVLLYLLVQINRFLGKFIFEKYMYKSEIEMPTTLYMLFSNSGFSKEYKNKIRDKIKADFDMHLPDEKDEVDNLLNSKKRIAEAIGLVKQKVKNGRLLLQHNIEYGFMRNLIGGSLIGLIMSIIVIAYFFKHNNQLIAYIGLGLALFYFLLLLFHRPLIKHLGNEYAKRLFQEYLQK
jgi:hypothetical protein